MGKPLTTLHVDLGKQWRGGQSQALLLMQGLRARGHVAELLAVRGSPLAERALAADIRVHTVRPSAARFRAVVRVRQLLKEARFDLVHGHDAHGLTAAWLAAAHRHASLIASRRVVYPLSQTRFGRGRYSCARRIIAVSCFVRESVLACGLPGDHVEVIYDGVEAPPLPTQEERLRARQRWDLPASGDSPLVGCVGYLLPDKNQELLIRALPIVREQCRDCRLLLAGNGPCRADLEKLALQLGVGQAVRFAGMLDDVSQVYQALDVFLFPSTADALGSSLLSAMAHGLPAVALGYGAVPEVIEDGRNGLLVQTPDPGAFAAAALRLLRDRALWERIGIAARQTIEERFSAGRMVQDTVDLYRRAGVGSRPC
jgi:glycosyltransferase involved in cell wall biosynthesis